ncbi:MAG: LysR family transcriptional regulator [Opitutaceae bacterium]|nr:LysR family transcriptional regulator [Opitutaceae bacterium]MBP9912806.1 LysR family transcriptional regulator [Opitutaceae bacterium]
MELYQLRYLVAVAEMENFTRASEKLFVTQPTLSQQIIKLEKELGCKLFHRLGRKAILTEAGTIFINRARRILFEADNAAKELKDDPALERRIHIGAIPTVAPYLLPALIALCRERYPNIQVDVREDFKPQLVRGVLEGELDLAITAQPIKNRQVAVEPLLTEPLLLVVSHDHPFAKREKVFAHDLAEETFVILGNSSSLAEQVRNFCGDNKIEPRVGFRCAQVATVKSLVGIGAGISILPRVTRAKADATTLAYIELADVSPSRELVIIRHLQRYQSRGVTQFLSLLHESVQAHLLP